MLSKAQNALYWREWAAAKRALMPGRETWTKAEEEERRHDLHCQALGADKSHVDFTNADFDKVLGAFRAVSQPDNLAAQLRQLNQERGRLLYGIRREARANGLGDAYVQAIVGRMNSEGALRSSDLDELGPEELRKVRIALTQHERRGVVAETAEMPF